MLNRRVSCFELFPVRYAIAETKRIHPDEAQVTSHGSQPVAPTSRRQYLRTSLTERCRASHIGSATLGKHVCKMRFRCLQCKRSESGYRNPSSAQHKPCAALPPQLRGELYMAMLADVANRAKTAKWA
eukprot:6387511-Pyramimonas_sp.AAC.1